MDSNEPVRHFLKLQPLSKKALGPGLHRLARVIVEAPSASFSVTLETPLLQVPVTVFAAYLPGRVTTLSIVIERDRSFEINLNLLQYPDKATEDEAGHLTDLPFPRQLRRLQVAHQLFASKQLYAHDGLNDLLWLKWLDPIVGVMAMLELLRCPIEERWLSDQEMRDVAHKLRLYFPDLPDAKVVAMLQCSHCREELVLEFKRGGGIPVLAECMRYIAVALNAESNGSKRGKRFAHLSSQLQLGQPWSVTTAAEELL
jgi:hypothetical protein